MAKNKKNTKNIVLCILDGWGEGKPSNSNAIHLANTPNWDNLYNNCQRTSLSASSKAVGLPDGQMGNSEVGHTNIGAGRIVMQDLPRINDAVTTGELAANKTLTEFAKNLKSTNSACHIMGLLSPGGVHSHQDHIVELCRIINDLGVRVLVHVILDGRDTPPQSAKIYLEKFTSHIKDMANVSIASIGGRYFAMDRDNNWDRIAKAYDALVLGEGEKIADPISYISECYARGITDEFIPPVSMQSYTGMQASDGLLSANFRADRVRQILRAILNDEVLEFNRVNKIELSGVLGMVSYSQDLNTKMQVLFPPQQITNSLGEVISKNGLRQLRLAETEKYAHVTYFFNGGVEELFKGEDRKMIPSPKVATYDLQPEMSANLVTEELCNAIASQDYSLIVVNYANPDMVGHTGKLPAAIKAVEFIDQCLGKVWQAIKSNGAILVITADHGNIEEMADEKSGQACTSHTTNLVPFVLCGYSDKPLKSKGVLADIAPTILELLDLDQPKEMSGDSILLKPSVTYGKKSIK